MLHASREVGIERVVGVAVVQEVVPVGIVEVDADLLDQAVVEEGIRVVRASPPCTGQSI